MNNLIKYFFLLLIFSVTHLNAQKKCIENREMGFKVQVPSNYKDNQFIDGSDKVHAFVSSDENVAVQVRAFDVDQNVSIDIVISAFEKSIIKGAQSLIKENYVLNGLNGKMSGYRWNQGNFNIIVGAFHTIQEGKAYVIWSLIPENLFSKRNAESDAITNSFTLIKKETISNIPQVVNVPPVIEERKIEEPLLKNLTPDNFITLVSDDACVEHLIPKDAKLTRAEEGLKVWEYPLGSQGNKISVVLQNVLKQGDVFKNFMENNISSIIKNGAAVLSKKYDSLNGMESCTYVYELNNSRFLYTVVNGPKTFFMLGFVGKIENKNDIDNLHNAISPSIKKADCDGVVSKQEKTVVPQTSSIQQTGNYKQIILDNNNNAYSFAKDKLSNAVHLADSDILNEPWCTDLPALCGNWVATGKSKMEEVTIPPTSGYISDGQSFIDCQEAPLNQVIVFKLKDGSFAKLMILKDEKSKTSDQCQHKITCIIDYPAFKTSNQVENKVSGFWPHVAEKTKSATNESKPTNGYKLFYQYGEFSFQVPVNWQSQSQSGRTTWYNPQKDGGLISHMQLHESTSFDKFVNTASTATLKNLGVRTIGGFETCMHQSKTIVGMQNNIVLRTDIIYIKTPRKVHMITFQANEGVFNPMLEPHALHLLNSLIKN